jgi:hypothetical protein
MLSGAAAATDAQEVEVHRSRNLTITAYNSTLSNKSFTDKRERVDSAGRFIAANATDCPSTRHWPPRSHRLSPTSTPALTSWRTNSSAASGCSGSGFPVGRDAYFWE